MMKEFDGLKESQNFSTATSNFWMSGMENRKVTLTLSSSFSSAGCNHGCVWWQAWTAASPIKPQDSDPVKPPHHHLSTPPNYISPSLHSFHVSSPKQNEKWPSRIIPAPIPSHSKEKDLWHVHSQLLPSDFVSEPETFVASQARASTLDSSRISMSVWDRARISINEGES